MPPRITAAHRMAHEDLPGTYFSYGDVDPDCGHTQDEWEDAVRSAYERIDRVADSIDWNRVLFEALVRCSALEHDHAFNNDPVRTRTCGQSVREVLRMTGTCPRWADLK